MTLFLNAHADRLAPGSFQQPVPIPANLPGSPDLVTVCFNKDWLPVILGSLFQLTLNTTWKASSQTELMNALQMANDLILIFQLAKPGCQDKLNPGFAGSGDDFMLRQNPDNPCELQTSVDGVTWCTWADISLCVSNKQPAQGSIQPPAGGGCTKYQGEVSIGDRWLLPNNVSTGDTVKISHANGLWSTPLDLFIPRCPDGNLWFEVACVEGTGHTEPGDPAPTINHDSLIGWDGTNYYDFGAASDGMDVTITIAAGISRQPFYLMCNTPDTSGSGNVVFDAEYCNNAVANWTHVFDFTSTTGAFSPFPVGGFDRGVWAAGQGWTTTDVNYGPNSDRAMFIRRTFAATTITRIQWDYDWVGAAGFPSSDNAIRMDDQTGTFVTVIKSAMPSGTPNTFDTGPISRSMTQLDLYFVCDDEVNPNPLSGSATLHTLTVSGTGVDPF